MSSPLTTVDVELEDFGSDPTEQAAVVATTPELPPHPGFRAGTIAELVRRGEAWIWRERRMDDADLAWLGYHTWPTGPKRAPPIPEKASGDGAGN